MRPSFLPERGEGCLDFDGDRCQLLLPVLRPGRDAFPYCLNFVLGHDLPTILAGRPLTLTGGEGMSVAPLPVDAAHAEVFDLEELLDAVFRALTADAAFLHAAKRRDLG